MPPRPFFVADLSVQGELRHVAEYDYETLERVPGAADLIVRCSTELWRSPEEMEVPLSDDRGTSLRWKATATTAGLATVRRAAGDLVSLSVLAAGKDPNADASTFTALQQRLVRELRQTAFEPAFDMMQIQQRPLVATMTFAAPGAPADQRIAALADRAFAAAYFRYLGLA